MRPSRTAWPTNVPAQGFPVERQAHSGAILFRTKRHMQLFSDALNHAGVPNRILGLGGLLSAPEVVDVISVLRVVHDPSQGSALLRIAVGAPFRDRRARPRGAARSRRGARSP